jgi:hypothetical protein
MLDRARFINLMEQLKMQRSVSISETHIIIISYEVANPSSMEVFEKKNTECFCLNVLFYSSFAWLTSPINSATSILQYPHKKFKFLNISSYLISCLSLS